MVLQYIHYTVRRSHSGTIVTLCYDLRVTQMAIECLKTNAKLLFCSNTNKYRSELPKKLISDPVGQRTTKMQALKVCAGWESNPGCPKSSDSVYKIAKNVASDPKCRFFLSPTLLSCNFKSPRHK